MEFVGVVGFVEFVGCGVHGVMRTPETYCCVIMLHRINAVDISRDTLSTQWSSVQHSFKYSRKSMPSIFQKSKKGDS
ncbi:MAG: hypothetical protein K6T94_00490 [Paenibacillus sp.]|nr:hypothetical protein [Paenibacillus sp.]